MKKKKVNILFIILIVLICLTGIEFELDNDTFFDLSVGKSIINNGFYNIENTTIHEGLHYNSIHWLLEVIEYFINLKLGLIGVWLLFVFGFAIYGLIMYRSLKKIGISEIVSFIVTISAIMLIRPFMQIRAQTFVAVFLILILYSLEMLYKTNKNKYIILCMICFWIIANIQSYTFIITFSVFIPFILEKIFSFNKKDGLNGVKFIFVNKKIKKLIITIIGSFLIGLINPYGITIYYEPFIVLNGYAKAIIGELSCATIWTGVVLIPLLIVLVLLIVPKNKIRLRDLFMVLMYGFASMFILKFGLYAITCSAICIARLIEEYINEYDKNIFEKITLNEIPKIINGLLVGICFIFVIYNVNENLIFKNLIPESYYPIKAVEYIKNNLDYKNMRIYNTLNIGSYLEYNGIKCFIDSRNELFENNDDSKSIEKDYCELYSGTQNYKDAFDKYNIDYVLIENSSNNVIYNYISKDECFKNVYEDNNFVIYEKIK